MYFIYKALHEHLLLVIERKKIEKINNSKKKCLFRLKFFFLMKNSFFF